jgi:phosphoglycolate phosphatase-like HAD superfamily hydrolase
LLQDFSKQIQDLRFIEVDSYVKELSGVGEFCHRNKIGAADLVEIKKRKSQNNGNAQWIKASSHHELVETLLPYDLEKPDLLKRLFEEIYLGKKLFSAFYNTASIFHFSESLFEKEKIIPERKTLDRLFQRFKALPIYSEKPRAQGIHLLKVNNLLSYFQGSSSVFNEDIAESERNRGGTGEPTSLGKPNPTLFIEFVDQLASRTEGVAYIGDTVADSLMIQNARSQGLSNIMFIGVLSSAYHPQALFSQFIEYGADIIIKDVNNLTQVFPDLGGDKV